MFNRSHVITSKIQLKLKRWSSKLNVCVWMGKRSIQQLLSLKEHFHVLFCTCTASKILHQHFICHKRTLYLFKGIHLKEHHRICAESCSHATLSCHSTFFLSIHQQIFPSLCSNEWHFLPFSVEEKFPKNKIQFGIKLKISRLF